MSCSNLNFPAIFKNWMNYFFVSGKRAVMNKPSAEEMQEFMGQVAMFKDMKKSMVSNMTCVLTKLGKLDKNMGMYVGNYFLKIYFFDLGMSLG